MAKLIAQLKHWLNTRLNVPSWLRWTGDADESAERSSPDVVLEDLPENICHRLLDAVQALPNHPDLQAYIRCEVLEGLHHWQENFENGCNTLVFLSRPMQNISRLIPDSLTDWLASQTYAETSAIHILDWQTRPPGVDTLLTQLKQALQPALNAQDEVAQIVIIPNLNWCFLRSLEGLDSIEYLQAQIQENQKIFWVIGVGQVAWEYLDQVLHVGVYCPCRKTLPALSGKQLQAWFSSIVRQNDLQFPARSLSDKFQKTQKQDDPEHESSLEETFFERLAKVSEGIETIAAQIFLRSIQLESEDEDTTQTDEADDSASTHSADGQLPGLRLTWPTSPSLPDIEPNDSYILYSLLLHGNLGLAQLTESLGDPITQVNAVIQRLRLLSLIEQQGQTVQINPIYGLALCDRLSRENFVVH